MEAHHHTAEEIMHALRFGVDYRFTISVRQLNVVVRPLSISERIEVVNLVTADLASKEEAKRNTLTESSLLAMHTLQLATTPAPDSKVAPLLPTKLLQGFTNEELLSLLRAYNDGCDKLDPSMEQLSREQLDELVAAVKKSPSELAALPRPHLEKLALYLLTPAE